MSRERERESESGEERELTNESHFSTAITAGVIAPSGSWVRDRVRVIGCYEIRVVGLRFWGLEFRV